MYSNAAFNLMFRIRQYREAVELANRRNPDASVRTIERFNADILLTHIQQKAGEIIGANHA
jgi:uncharacterized short protein YbdD (DUF466 family)